MASRERRAVVTASVTAIFLMVLKGVTGYMTGSMAILTSAIDSALDFFVSLANYFAIRKSEKDSDESHNYGYGKIEAIGAVFEGLVIFGSGGFIIWSAIDKIIRSELPQDIGPAIWVMLASLIVTGALVAFLQKEARATKSLILEADALHYRSDLVTNLGILIALVVVKFLSLPIVDPVISIGIAIYIIHGSIGVIKTGIDMLMDRSIDQDSIDTIARTIGRYKDIESFHDLKSRRSGKTNFIEFHLVFRDAEISLKKAHAIGDAIENEILAAIEHAHVMVHLDYYDDRRSEANPKLRTSHPACPINQ